ncbi:MAG: phosphopantetheine-binding protein [Bacteroidales bacterium]|nr:phosphopantetheine-binding protein [Bacteroidales bacterium]
MTYTDIEARVKTFLIDEMEIDEKVVYADARLKEEMGIDSLDYVDIVVIVEREFGFKIKPEAIKEIKTLKDFCNYIAQQIS